MFCVLKQRDGKWYCTNCNGRPLKGDYKRICKANGQPPTPSHVDALAWFTARYAQQKITSPLADILAKLERCRSAECDKLQNDVCTMQGVSACKQRSMWFAMLAGGAVCQNWKVEPPSAPRILGVGDHLETAIHFFDHVSREGCIGSDHVATMNRNGPDWCDANIDTIVGWMQDEAAKRKLPSTAAGAGVLIREAIRQTRRDAKAGGSK